MKYLLLFERFYNPSNDVRNRLSKLVDDLEIEYGGGVPFFDALDEQLKSMMNEDMILDLVKGLSGKWVASSGGFGDTLYKLYEEGKFECEGLVIFNGKMLTNKTGVNSWYPTDFDLDDKDFIYIDDSYFSGSTVNKIDDYLKGEHNSKILETYVIYDGSKSKRNNVHSFFRYY